MPLDSVSLKAKFTQHTGNETKLVALSLGIMTKDTIKTVVSFVSCVYFRHSL